MTFCYQFGAGRTTYETRNAVNPSEQPGAYWPGPTAANFYTSEHSACVAW